MDDLETIIKSLGEQNEEIDDYDLSCIEEEIDSIEDHEYFELAKIVIRLGKPQILEYLLTNFNFNNSEIKAICDEIIRYQQVQHKFIEDSDDEEDIQEIIKDYKRIIKNFQKLPYKNNSKNKKKY
jgi:hypothetical protein